MKYEMEPKISTLPLDAVPSQFQLQSTFKTQVPKIHVNIIALSLTVSSPVAAFQVGSHEKPYSQR
jgi:hypothetical protein